MRKIFLTLRAVLIAGWCSKTLNLTVLDRGLHWPTVTMSPSLTLPKAGEQWTLRLRCLFSKLHVHTRAMHTRTKRATSKRTHSCVSQTPCFRKRRVGCLPSVLLDPVQVVPSDDDGVLHLGGDDDALQDAATDGHVAGERALLVDVGSLDRGLGGLESEANALVEPGALLDSRAKEAKISHNHPSNQHNNRVASRVTLRVFRPSTRFRARKTPSCFWNAFSFCIAPNQTQQSRGQHQIHSRRHCMTAFCRIMPPFPRL